MRKDDFERAMIEVSVCTASGIVPVKNAVVTVSYNALPGFDDVGIQVKRTDDCGNAGVFVIPIKRAMIGGRRVDFPRRAECSVEVCAEGYITLRTRGIHLFPGITVINRFELIPKEMCFGKSTKNKTLEA